MDLLPSILGWKYIVAAQVVIGDQQRVYNELTCFPTSIAITIKRTNIETRQKLCKLFSHYPIYYPFGNYGIQIKF